MFWEEVLFNLSFTGVGVWAFPLAGKRCLLLEQREEPTHLFHVLRFEFLRCKSQVLVTLEWGTLYSKATAQIMLRSRKYAK